MNFLYSLLFLLVTSNQVISRKYSCPTLRIFEDVVIIIAPVPIEVKAEIVEKLKNHYWGFLKATEHSVKNHLQMKVQAYHPGSPLEDAKIDDQEIKQLYNMNTVKRINLQQGILNSYYSRGEGIFMVVCPHDWISPDKTLYYPYPTNSEDRPIKRYDGATRCTLLHCELGLYFDKKFSTEEKILHDTDGRSVYLILLTNEGREAEFYFNYNDVLYNKDFNIPYVVCPYYNWIAKKNYIKFEPLATNINNGIEKGRGRHILVPAYPNLKENDDIFLCGHIIQKVAPDVRVGYKLHKGLSNTPKRLDFDGEKDILCDGYSALEHSIYIFTPENLKDNDGSIKIKYIRTIEEIKNIKFYYGQYLLFFKIILFNDYNEPQYRSQLEDQSSHTQLVCSGKIPEIGGTLHLMLNSKHVNFNPRINNATGLEMLVVVIDKSEYNGHVKAECTFVSKDKAPYAHDNFYSKQFKTYLYKGKLKDVVIDKNKVVEYLNLNEDPDMIYGFYSCITDTNDKTIPIKNIEMLFVPKNEIIFSKNEPFFFENLDIASCEKNVFGFGELKEMIVVKPNKKHYSNLINKKNFKEDKKLILYVSITPDDADNTIIECHYTAFNQPLMKATKKLLYQKKQISKDSTGLKIGVPIIITICVFIILMLVIIVVLTINKIKKKKKSNLFSMASSASSASKASVSKSKLSKSRSTSSSAKNKAKSLKSKSLKLKSLKSKSLKSNSKQIKTQHSKSLKNRSNTNSRHEKVKLNASNI
uniref:6-cysteine protein n=1 Tax=Parastrongyloides trichosuri TaxID=131310 RepID=A0A0N4ZEN0_PARTI